MKEKKILEYSIKGNIDHSKTKDLSHDVTLVAYAIRDRRVLASSPIEEDGSFNITYNYKSFGKEGAPYGVDIIIGPELPNDEILQTNIKRTFLSAKGFKPLGTQLTYHIPDPVVVTPQIPHIPPFHKCHFTYTGFVYTCSPLRTPPGGQAGCQNPNVLSCASGEVEAFVRLKREKNIIAEGIEVEPTGKFEITKKWWTPYFCFYFPQSIDVEVYQETDTGEHILYSGKHTFSDNIAEDIFIDREKTEIICIPPKPTVEGGNFFGFERVGNIPVEAIYQAGEITGEFGAGVPVPDEFIGYANSVDKPHVTLGSADLKLKDFAFYSTLHFYGNLGENFGVEYEEGIDMSDVDIKYFRLKCSYLNPETGETLDDEYVSVPFNNTRKTATGTTAENMRVTTHPVSNDALTIPTYIYPNPYETDVDKNWRYRGLMLVLNTNTLPYAYGRYTFTIIPLDKDMNEITETSTVSIEESKDCQLILLIDNDQQALTGEIESVGTTSPCGVIDLKHVAIGTASDIKVKYNLNHTHKNLQEYRLSAQYGKGKSIAFPLSNNVYTRSGLTPYWQSVHNTSTKHYVWEKCAYQFRLSVRRRVTNGFSTRTWETFTYHVSIDSHNTYTP